MATQISMGLPIKSAIATGTTGGLGTEAGVLSETYPQVIANKRLTLKIALPYTLGGIVGVWVLLHVPQAIIKDIMIAAVVLVLLHSFHARKQRKSQHLGKTQNALLFLFMFLASVYGSIAPGEGTFSKFALMSVLGLTFLQSQGIKSAATVPARIYTMLATSIAGLVVWPYAMTLWVSTFVGSKYATRIAKRIPDKYLRALLAAVSIAFVAYLLLSR